MSGCLSCSVGDSCDECEDGTLWWDGFNQCEDCLTSPGFELVSGECLEICGDDVNLGMW